MSYLICIFQFQNNSKYIRAKINVSMLCQTFLDPPDIDPKKATRDNLICKIFYVAHGKYSSAFFPQVFMCVCVLYGLVYISGVLQGCSVRGDQYNWHPWKENLSLTHWDFGLGNYRVISVAPAICGFFLGFFFTLLMPNAGRVK